MAQAIAAHAKAHGGALTGSDLAAWRPEWVEPIGPRLRRPPPARDPPNGQGIAALIALGILAFRSRRHEGADGVEAQHLQIEAMKLAFADTYRYVADPRSMEVTPRRC